MQRGGEMTGLHGRFNICFEIVEKRKRARGRVVMLKNTQAVIMDNKASSQCPEKNPT